MEQEKTLPLPDGKFLYYVHTANGNRPNSRVIVHLHGLSGWPYEVASTAMAQQFPDHGYDVVRPYLYHWADGARVLHETTIAINAADVEALIDELQKQYVQIFITGHSYGGPGAMALRQDRLAAVSLWDPTYVPQINEDPRFHARHGGLLLSKGACWFLISDAFMDEARTYTRSHAQEVSAGWHRPIQVIHAAGGLWAHYEGGESFHSHAGGPTDHHVIDGTVHCFVEGDTTPQLLHHVRQWFDRF